MSKAFVVKRKIKDDILTIEYMGNVNFPLNVIVASEENIDNKTMMDVSLYMMAYFFELYSDEEEFYRAEKAEEIKFAARSMVPVGMFDLENPSAKLLLNGIVKSVNPVDDVRYTHEVITETIDGLEVSLLITADEAPKEGSCITAGGVMFACIE